MAWFSEKKSSKYESPSRTGGGQWQIQHFPDGGPNQELLTYYFWPLLLENCMELKKLTEMGTSLEPPWIRRCGCKKLRSNLRVCVLGAFNQPWQPRFYWAWMKRLNSGSSSQLTAKCHIPILSESYKPFLVCEWMYACVYYCLHLY